MSNSVRLSPEVSSSVTFQSYAPQPAIDGIFHRPLTKHRALEGWFMEYTRLDSGVIEGLSTPFTIRQISVSKAVPGRVNAFHVHPKQVQDEIWCVLEGTMMIWVVDCREGSPTFGTKRRYILGGEAPALLYIPSGVAHGYKAGSEGALLLYAMNSQFDVKDPNEGRLPWDYFGAQLWEEDRG